MPVNILFVEGDSFDSQSIKDLLISNSRINYHIIDNFNVLQKELYFHDYSHIIAPFMVNEELIVDYLKLIKIPLLVVTQQEISSFSLKYVKLPLSYPTLFNFICEKLIISYETLDNYAFGDINFLNKIQSGIISEFEKSLNELPNFIQLNNLEAIQANVHKLVGKLGMLNMRSSYNLSLQIDKKIIEEPEKQLNHLNQLLLDLEIALVQLKQ